MQIEYVLSKKEFNVVKNNRIEKLKEFLRELKGNSTIEGTETANLEYIIDRIEGIILNK